MEWIVDWSCWIWFEKTWLWFIIFHHTLLLCIDYGYCSLLHLLRSRSYCLPFTYILYILQSMYLCSLINYFDLTSSQRKQYIMWFTAIIICHSLRCLLYLVRRWLCNDRKWIDYLGLQWVTIRIQYVIQVFVHWFIQQILRHQVQLQHGNRISSILSPSLV